MTNEAKQASAFVKRKIVWISESKNDSGISATLAKFRRGIGKPPGSMPEIWELTFDGLPEELLSKDGIPTKGEWAVYTALTLYALHQQGKNPSNENMNKEGATLGRAVRALVKRENDEDEVRIKRRFDAAATSSSIEEISHHLRGLVQLLKSENIPMDYSRITEDLYWFQIPEMRDRVRLRSGQDFYSSKYGKEKENEEQ